MHIKLIWGWLGSSPLNDCNEYPVKSLSMSSQKSTGALPALAQVVQFLVYPFNSLHLYSPILPTPSLSSATTFWWFDAHQDNSATRQALCQRWDQYISQKSALLSPYQYISSTSNFPGVYPYSSLCDTWCMVIPFLMCPCATRQALCRRHTQGDGII